MKILIVYFSQTGNTAKIARAICEAVLSQGHKAILKQVDEITAESLNDYDLVFLGSTCHDTDLAKPAKQLLEQIGDSSPFRLAGFVTHATHIPERSERARELFETWAGNCVRTFERMSEEKHIAFLGYFHCQGAPSLPIEAFIHNTIITNDDEWAAYSADVRGHPDKADLKKAKEFAQQVLNKC